jgi:Maf1 regulator
VPPDPSSRKTLIFLILTLNHVFPDYDFSCLRGHHFRKEEGLEATRELVNGQLLEPARMFGAFAATPELETLWSRLEEVIVPSECDIYSYTAEAEGDPFSELGALWSWNRFFFNRKQKRIVCFTCTGVRKRAEDGDDSQLSEEGDFATWDAADMDE